MHSQDQFGKTIQLFLVDGKPYSFTSPSAASAVILNRSSNGRTEWKVKDSKQTYADWQLSSAPLEEATL